MTSINANWLRLCSANILSSASMNLACIAQVAQDGRIQGIEGVAVDVATVKVEVGLIRVGRLRPMLRPQDEVVQVDVHAREVIRQGTP